MHPLTLVLVPYVLTFVADTQTMGKGGSAAGPNDGKAENGAKLFKAKCATCHTANEGGPNKQGPNLFGVIGRQSGQVRARAPNSRA